MLKEMKQADMMEVNGGDDYTRIVYRQGIRYEVVIPNDVAKQHNEFAAVTAITAGTAALTGVKVIGGLLGGIVSHYLLKNY